MANQALGFAGSQPTAHDKQERGGGQGRQSGNRSRDLSKGRPGVETDRPTHSHLQLADACISETEISEVVGALRAGYLAAGPKTRQFEHQIARLVGADDALALHCHTNALKLALKSVGIAPGDEVITTPIGGQAAASAIESIGAICVLADIQPDTLNIDPAQVEAKVTPSTRAIVVHHFAGHPANLDTLREIARANDVAIIEDASEALSAKYRGEWIGSHGNPTAFSFYTDKNITTGQGGMLTGCKSLIQRAKAACVPSIGLAPEPQAQETPDDTHAYLTGGAPFQPINSATDEARSEHYMTDLQAALGLGQLKRLPQFQVRRREIAARYKAGLSRLFATGVLEQPTVRHDVEHAWHGYILRVRLAALSIDRPQFTNLLRQHGVPTPRRTKPVHTESYFARKYGFRPRDFPVALRSYEQMLHLPIHPGMSDADVDHVIRVVTDICDKHQR